MDLLGRPASIRRVVHQVRRAILPKSILCSRTMTTKTSPKLHRQGCTFGSGFYRIELESSKPRYCQTEKELRYALTLLRLSTVTRVCRDGFCLDPDDYPDIEVPIGDANTPDVVDAEWWLGLPQAEAMREVGITSDADYVHVLRSVEAAVTRRNQRASEGADRASIVIKKVGKHVADA